MLNLQNDQILSISSSISLQFYIKKSFIWFDAVFINSYYNNTLQIDLICDKTLFSLQCDRIFNHKKNRVADFVTINIGSPHKHTHSLYNKNNLILSLPNKKQKRTCTIRKYSSILVSVELLVMPYVLTVVLRTIIYIHMCVCVHTYIHIVCISHEEAYNWLYEINCISACVYKWMCVWMMKVNVWRMCGECVERGAVYTHRWIFGFLSYAGLAVDHNIRILELHITGRRRAHGVIIVVRVGRCLHRKVAQ